ncbi:hypothetical protein F2P56_027267, partial [Juglans regia]
DFQTEEATERLKITPNKGFPTPSSSPQENELFPVPLLPNTLTKLRPLPLLTYASLPTPSIRLGFFSFSLSLSLESAPRAWRTFSQTKAPIAKKTKRVRGSGWG